MKTEAIIRVVILAFASFIAPPGAFAQGTLTPPGAPAPTMKTLDQIEPRTLVNTTNTPGDATSMFIITAPGSYYLSGNITGVAGKNGIKVTADDVSIDLNGFAVIGVASSLEGIVSGTLTNLSITNGTVRSWVGDGIHALSASNGQYQNLRLSANGLKGMNVGPASNVVNCTALGNSTSGIVAGLGSTITSCTANSNGLHGFITDPGTTLRGCTAYANGQRGMSVSDACNVSDSTIRSNLTDGIVTGNDCIVYYLQSAGNISIRNTARANLGVNYLTVAGNTVGPVVGASDTITNSNPWANFSY
jgi:hypothetical protein